MPSAALLAQRLPWPVDWPARFGRAAPLLVEIGFGGGHFLVDLATRRTEANVLGVEISNPSLRRTEDRLRRHGLSNVCLVYGGAQSVLWALCHPGSLAGVYVNFPDPWPKAAHHHRRLINDRFLRLLATRMAPGAPLDIATDHADYQAWIADCLARSPHFESRTDATYLTDDPTRPRTKYERQALEAGVTCHYFLWQRNESPGAVAFPIPQELAIPNVLIETRLSLALIHDRFAMSEGAYGPVRVRLLEAYAAARHRSLMVEVFVSEEPVSQRVGLLIQERGPGRLLLSLHEIGFPRATAGMHAALRHLADWLITMDPEANIVRDNLAVVAGNAAPRSPRTTP